MQNRRGECKIVGANACRARARKDKLWVKNFILWKKL